MSWNLGSITCHYCHSDIVLEERFRPLHHDETWDRFRNSMQGELFANAHCPACEAQYLAWGGVAGVLCDLSYRSSADDEPSDDGDYPKWRISKTVVYRRVAPHDHRVDGWMPELEEGIAMLAGDGGAVPDLEELQRRARIIATAGIPPITDETLAQYTDHLGSHRFAHDPFVRVVLAELLLWREHAARALQVGEAIKASSEDPSALNAAAERKRLGIPDLGPITGGGGDDDDGENV